MGEWMRKLVSSNLMNFRKVKLVAFLDTLVRAGVTERACVLPSMLSVCKMTVWAANEWL